MSSLAEIKYRAFLSYCHADKTWAKWLHGALEGFRIDKDLIGRETSAAKIPASLRPIFRDRDEFIAGDTLSSQTIAALDATAALILLCSPAAAKSRNSMRKCVCIRRPPRLGEARKLRPLAGGRSPRRENQ